MKRVLLFSRDPGGANTIVPLVRPLREKGYDVRLYGKDSALGKYRQAHLVGDDITTVLISGITPNSLRQFLVHESPDIIITGTSADDFTEKFIWKAAGELGISSIAIMDQWLNYGLRFSDHGVNDIEEYEHRKVLPYLPTRISAMDEYSRIEMIAEGLPAERVVVCGQPYFETLLASRNYAGDIDRFCSFHNVTPEEFVVVFASEPMTTTFGDGALRYWGYNERTILASLVSALDKVAADSLKPVTLIVRPHPKEGNEHFMDILGQCKHVRWFFDTMSSPWTLMNRADLICGMSSMFLIESVILKRPTLSIQIGLNRDNPFIFARRGIMKCIVTEEELLEQLRRAIIVGELPEYDFEIILNPVERIISEMENLLCHNLR